MSARRRWKRPPSLQRFLSSKTKRRNQGKSFKTFSIDHERPQAGETSFGPGRGLRSNTLDSSEDEWDHWEDRGEDGDELDQPNDCSRPRTSKSSHILTVQKQREKWTELIPVFVQATAEKMSLSDDATVVCLLCEEGNACIRCLDCGPNVVYCKSCCLKEHNGNRHMYHTPEWWNGFRFIPVIENVVISPNHSCPTAYEETLTIVTLRRKLMAYIIRCYH